MKYAFNSWAYGSFPSWRPAYSLDDTIRRIAVAGYSAMEIGCASPHAWPAYLSDSRRKDIRARAEGEGVKIISLLPAPGGGPGCNPCSILAEEREFTKQHYCDVIDLAADLAAGLVLYIAGWRAEGMSRDLAWTLSIVTLQVIAAYATDRGIVIAIEPTSADSNLVDSAEDALKLMRDSGYKNVKVMFDTCHLLYRNEDGADYVRKMGTDLVHIHLADTGRSAPGDGDFNWTTLLQALKHSNFDGYLTVEAGFASRDVDPDDVAQRSLGFLQNLELHLDLPANSI